MTRHVVVLCELKCFEFDPLKSEFLRSFSNLLTYRQLRVVNLLNVITVQVSE